MLYTSLVVSAILLLIANLFACRAEHPVRPIRATALLFLIGLAPAVMCVFLPPVILQAALLSIVFLILWAARWGTPRAFFLLSCAATLIAYALPGFFAFQDTRDLQAEFAYVSMDDRLPLSRTSRPATPAPPATVQQVNAVEERLERDAQNSMGRHRESALRQLHEETMQVFVNQPGFGAARMIRPEVYLKWSGRQKPPIPHPGTPSASPWFPEELSRKQPAESKTLSNLLSFHQESVVDFVNLPGFGYIKDRQHVAGFQAHQVSQTPTPERPWTLQTLDLVRLLLHEKPTAYVSKDLPRMKELLAAPTRDLDEFETAGLFALQRGDDLFVRERGSERRMLGAIRAARQCLSCHDAERGDLFGAFSYRMTQGGQ
jgi:hypothetical protein